MLNKHRENAKLAAETSTLWQTQDLERLRGAEW